MKPGTRGDIQVPEVPLRPGRGAFSRRTRLLFIVGLAVALVVIAVVGGLLAGSKRQPPRSVTIPVADRNATPALIRAAEAVGFQPPSASGTGQIENEPAASAPSTGAGLLDVGAQAPDFTLRTPAGTPVRLAALRGKSVLLEFFATWCPHCAAEAPHLRRLARSLPRSRVAFVGVDANGGDAPSVFAYHVYYDLPFPAVLDPGGTTATLPVARLARQGLEGLPDLDLPDVLRRRPAGADRLARGGRAARRAATPRAPVGGSREGVGGHIVSRAGGLQGRRDRLRRRLTTGGESRARRYR